MQRYARLATGIIATYLLTACAGMQSMLSAPEVRLVSIAIGAIGFDKQTFLLHFDVSNPNAFALPINHVSYSVRLNEQQFASGESAADFNIAANGTSEFTISVDLDLLRTAPQLLYTVRDGVNRSMPYELSGKFGVALPFVDRVAFRSSGHTREP